MQLLLRLAFGILPTVLWLKLIEAHSYSWRVSKEVVTQRVGDTDGVVSPLTSGEANDLDAVGSAEASAGPTQTDIGILRRQKLQDGNPLVGTSRALEDQGDCPPSDIVTCVHGDVASGGSCQSACEGHCCVDPDDSDYDPCYAFTGTVCKDDTSCFGHAACRNANIDKIVRGCNGLQSCDDAGSPEVPVTEIIDSCIGTSACSHAYIDKIVRGCNEIGACYQAGSSERPIKEIIYSCMGTDACFSVDNVEEIVDSCVGHRACRSAEEIVSITRSCSATEACFFAGKDATQPFDLADCCNKNEECQSIRAAPSTCGTNTPTSAPTSNTTDPTSNP